MELPAVLEFDGVYLAAVGAALAGETGLPVGGFRETEPPEGRFRSGRTIPGDESGSYRARNVVIGRDRDLSPEDGVEGRHDSFVERGGALEQDAVSRHAVAYHPVQVVLHDRIAQPADYVLHRGAARLVCDHVALHEDGAPLSQACGGRSLQRNRTEFADA